MVAQFQVVVRSSICIDDRSQKKAIAMMMMMVKEDAKVRKRKELHVLNLGHIVSLRVLSSFAKSTISLIRAQ